MSYIPRVVVDLFICSCARVDAKCLSCDLSHPCVIGKYPVGGVCPVDFGDAITAVFSMVQTLGKRSCRFDNVKQLLKLPG